jgi:hypothetical protein
MHEQDYRLSNQLLAEYSLAKTSQTKLELQAKVEALTRQMEVGKETSACKHTKA